MHTSLVVAAALIITPAKSFVQTTGVAISTRRSDDCRCSGYTSSATATARKANPSSKQRGSKQRGSKQRGGVQRMSADGDHDILLRVAKGEKADRSPVWLMRQVGFNLSHKDE